MIKAIFLIQSPDSKGILASVTGFFSERGYNILHCQQHTDSYEKRFFMRIELDAGDMQTSRKELEDEFGALASSLGLEWSCHWSDYRMRVAILVSKAGHCLYDLIARQLEGELKTSLAGVQKLVLDLEELEYISSAGLRVLLSTQKTMKKQGSMVVRHVSPIVMEVFEMTGFSDFLTIE